MSLPTPQIGNANAIDPRDLDALDAPLIALVTRCNGDMRQLFYHFFSFLHRRTDFYLVPHADDLQAGTAKMGFREGDAEKLLIAAFRQFPLRGLPQQLKTRDNDASREDNTHASTASEEDLPIGQKPKKPDNHEVRRTEDGLQIPIGNGGSTAKYKWTQTIDECSVLIGVPDGIRGKDLAVTIKALAVHVQSKVPLGDESESYVFLHGDLTEKIIPAESTWSLEGGVLVLVLYKLKKTFWKAVIKGDDEIDTTMVDSRRRIDDYDEATQAQIRKIVLDQNQQRRGKPTSNELSGDKPAKLVPPLPPGVEYIDQNVLDRAA